MKIALPKKPEIEDNRDTTSKSSSTQEADERRLRKLKGFLKSISYNGSEGMRFESLNDIYRDDLLLDRSPCIDIHTLGEFKCNPTPFLVSSCFNRTQVDTKGRLQRGSKKTLKKSTPSRTRKIPTLKKNTTTLSQIYGKMEGKIEIFKPMPRNKLGVSKGKVVAPTQGRRPTLDDVIKTAVQSGKSRMSLMKEVEHEKKEENKMTPEHKSAKQETKGKTREQESAKEKQDEDEDNTFSKQLIDQKENNSGTDIDADSFTTTSKEINSHRTKETKTPEDEPTQQSCKKELDQKTSDNIENPSAAGEKSEAEENKSGKSTTEESKNTTKEKSITGKTSFKLVEVEGNSANTERVFKTKKQEFEKSNESNEKCITDSNGSCRLEEEKLSHLKPGKKSLSTPSVTSPMVTSTSTESTKRTTRLQRLKSRTDHGDKDGQQTRLRRRQLTYNPKTNASPYKNNEKETANHYCIRRRQQKETNTK